MLSGPLKRRRKVRLGAFRALVLLAAALPRMLHPETGRVGTTPQAGAPRLAFRFSLASLGYQAPEKASPTEAAPVEQVHFLDADHILFTHRRPMLFDRTADNLEGDEDRGIRADVMSLPSGKVEATADWRMHDHGPYLWAMAGGQFLVRIRNKLFWTDKGLVLHPFLQAVSHLESVQVSADGRTLILETEVERHTPKIHKALTERALATGAPLPTEDVRVLVIRTATRTVIAESRETHPLLVSVLRNGYVETKALRAGEWTLQYVPFGGKPKQIAAVISKCDPQTSVLNADTILLATCPAATGIRGAVALTTTGTQLWSIAPNRELVLPRFLASADGSEVALSRLRLSTAVNAWVPLVHDGDVNGQEIEVISTQDGTVRLHTAAIPAQGYGHNHALSPDGRRLAVLDRDTLAVYDLPGTGTTPVAATEPTETADNEAPFTRYHEFKRESRPLNEADIDLAAKPPDFVTEAVSDTTGLRTMASAADPNRTANKGEGSGVSSTVPGTGRPDAPEAPSAGGTDTGGPTAGKTVLHSSTNLVVVDVTVTDKHGNPIRGLDRSRFHLSEGGHEQKISYFEEAQPGSAAPRGAKVLPPDVYSNLPKYPPTGAVNVLLLDALNTPYANQADVHRQVLQYLSHMQPGATIAVFALNGKLQLVQGFTTDPAELILAMNSKTALPRPSVALDTGSANASQALGDHTAANAPMQTGQQRSADLTSLDYQAAADIRSVASDRQTQFTLGALQQLARYLFAIPGRKNLIWFSASFPMEVQPDYSLRESTKNERQNGEVVEQTGRLLAQARVAVYPVYVLGPTQLASVSASFNFGDGRAAGMGAGSGFQTEDTRTADEQRNNQDSLRKMAEQTGGHYVNTNDFKEAMGSAIANGSSYYTIGYVPLDKKLDGHFRPIKLRLDDAPFTISYRRGYFAGKSSKSPAESLQRLNAIQSSTVPGAPPSTQIEFLARVLPATDLQPPANVSGESGGNGAATLKGPVTRYVVDLAVNPHDLTFEEMPNGHRQSEVEYYVVAYDEAGKRLNYVDRGIRLNLTPEQYVRVMGANVVHRIALDLPTGLCAVRIVVYDPASTHLGSIEIPVVPAGRVTTAAK